MKALKNRTPFIIVTAFMLLTISAFGISKSVISSNDIAEINKSDIVLLETVALENENVLYNHGEPVKLEAGTCGEIRDVIDWYGEKTDINTYARIFIWIVEKESVLY